MSGIAGAFDLSGRLPGAERIRMALEAMRRRGADAASVFEYPGCLIGLTLFDPSADGRHLGTASDPVSGARLVVDGILDSIDLRGETGIRLVRALEDDPAAVLSDLRGDFALALWSPGRRRLLLARDHLGTRPLCIHHDGGRVLFGSTPGALKALGVVPEVDREAIGLLLRLGLVPAPWSGWKGIERLRPSEFVTCSESGRESRTYWEYRLEPETGRSETDHVRGLRRALEEAIAEQVAGAADPLFCMSGGIDSTAIAGIARRQFGRPIRTVVLGFQGRRGDDRPYARRAAEYVGTDHHEIEVTASMLDDHLDRIADTLEVPSLLSFTEYFLSLDVAASARLLITGEMADSQFGGTRPFDTLYWLGKYRRIPGTFRHGFPGRLVRTLPKDFPLFGKHPSRIADLLHTIDTATPAGRYLGFRSVLSPEQTDRLLGTTGEPDRLTQRYLTELTAACAGNPVEEMLACHIRHEAPNEYLADDYKLAAPVVYRSPFASQRVAAAAMSIPWGLKVKGKVRKHVLIEAVRDVLPPETITRRKMGFSLPMNEWLAGPLRHRLEHHLAPERLPGFLDPSMVRTVVDRFLAAPDTTDMRPVWLLLTISLWHAAHLGSVPAGDR